jgi:dihydropyrimidinase
VHAWPAVTLSRGEVVWSNGQPQGRAGRGEFLKAARPEPAAIHSRRELATSLVPGS